MKLVSDEDKLDYNILTSGMKIQSVKMPILD